MQGIMLGFAIKYDDWDLEAFRVSLGKRERYRRG
jgi:hypothetical protein